MLRSHGFVALLSVLLLAGCILAAPTSAESTKPVGGKGDAKVIEELTNVFGTASSNLNFAIKTIDGTTKALSKTDTLLSWSTAIALLISLSAIVFAIIAHRNSGVSRGEIEEEVRNLSVSIADLKTLIGQLPKASPGPAPPGTVPTEMGPKELATSPLAEINTLLNEVSRSQREVREILIRLENQRGAAGTTGMPENWSAAGQSSITPESTDEQTRGAAFEHPAPHVRPSDHASIGYRFTEEELKNGLNAIVRVMGPHNFYMETLDDKAVKFEVVREYLPEKLRDFGVLVSAIPQMMRICGARQQLGETFLSHDNPRGGPVIKMTKRAHQFFSQKNNSSQ